jgi:hypothetical protein
MYFWKCWRNTRLIVVLYVLYLAFMVYVLRHDTPYINLPVSNEEAAWQHIGGSTILIGLAAWMLGNVGIGRDIADGSGAFLLSRPRSRRFFVWSDTTVAVAELLGMIVLPVALFVASLHFRLIGFIASGEGAALHSKQISYQLASSAGPLIVLTMLLFAALVYGVTYLCTILVRRSSVGIVLSVCIFISYAWLRSELRQWPGHHTFQFPSWMLNPFVATSRNFQLAPHLAISLLARGAIVLLLVFAAQLCLEREEIA